MTAPSPLSPSQKHRTGPASGSRIEEIAAILLRRVAEGVYPVGENIPNELDLCAEFAASRYTIREALRHLEERGLVQRRKRAGTRVMSAAGVPQYGLNFESADSLGHYLEHTDLKLGRVVTRLTRQPEETRLDGDLADWVQLETWRCAPGTDQAISFSTIYLRREFLGVTDLIGKERGGIYELLGRRFRKQLRFIDVEVSAAPFRREAARRLGKTARERALLIIRRFHGTDDRLFEVSVSWYPPELVQYKTRIMYDAL